MYTEIKEAVNFVAAYLLGKIPRRTVGLFCQEFANLLLRRNEPIWWAEDHKKDEERRIIKFFGEDRSLNRLIRNAMKIVGMSEDEAKIHFPEHLIIYINPGSVFLKMHDRGTPVPIWMGSTDADKEYQSYPEHVLKAGAIEKAANANNMGAAGRSMPLRSSECIIDNFVPLQLEALHPALMDSPLAVAGELKHFVYLGKDQRKFLVADFALTRFGSHKNRPDHDSMKKIQDRAGVVEEDLVKSPPKSDSDSGTSASCPGTPHWKLQEQIQFLSAEERHQLMQHLSQLNSCDYDQQSFLQEVAQSYMHEVSVMNLKKRKSPY